MKPVSTWLLLGFAILPTLNAATISFLGSDEATAVNWRTTSVAKPAPFDPGGDDAYGNDGFYVINSGIGAGAPVTRSLPSYIASVTDYGGRFNGNGYPDFDTPVRVVGSVVQNANAGIFFANGAGVKSIVDFELAQDASFVLTIPLVGDNSAHRPSALSVTQTVGGAATAAATLPTPASGDAVNYLFFDISGLAGDRFEVVINGPASIHGIGGLAFESHAAPTLAFLGVDEATTVNWRSTAVAKESAVDPDGDNAFATDGFYAINSGGAGAPSVSALPAYISSVADHGGTHNAGGYPDFDNPGRVIGASVADANAGIFFASVAGSLAIVDFELAAPADFVLTIPLVGNAATHRPSSLSVTRTVGGAASSTAIVPTAANGDAVNYVFQCCWRGRRHIRSGH